MIKNYTFFIVLLSLFLNLENIQAQTQKGLNSNINAKGTTATASHLNFDGVNDRVSIPTQPVSNLNNFTLEAWVYTAASTYQTIYAEGNVSDNNPMFSITKMPNTAGFEIVLRNSASVGLVVSTTTGYVQSSTWTHVAFVRTSATTASLYINGVNTDNFTFANPGSINVNVANIGVRQRVGFDGWLNGNLDEVRIWNRILPIVEIQNNMNCELSTPTTQIGLLTYYQFNQGVDGTNNTAVTSLTDSSVMGNNGTLINFSLTSTTSNWLSGSIITTGNTCTPFLSTVGFDNNSNFKIYPNPATNTINIDLLSIDNSNIEVYDMNGKKIFTQELNYNSNKINIDKLSSGIYLFKVNSDKGSATSKVFKS
ncbi:MAG: LamG-like jellyroll fold domain-containing protein [Flavobacterium sp.]